MTVYDLYLESGPKRRKTMVHALDLLGCLAVGPTTEEALAAAPEAIRAYRRFLRRHGEPIDPDAPFETRVVEHVTEGDWLGNGSPYLVFGPDLAPTTDEIASLLQRLGWLCEALAARAAAQGDDALDAPPPAGRTARAILLHVIGSQGGALAAALGGAPGFSALQGAAGRGELPLAVALRRLSPMATDRVWAATPAERTAVRHLSAGTRIYTLRKALRRMLEHDWEHLAELSRRPGGPAL